MFCPEGCATVTAPLRGAPSALARQAGDTRPRGAGRAGPGLRVVKSRVRGGVFDVAGIFKKLQQEPNEEDLACIFGNYKLF